MNSVFLPHIKHELTSGRASVLVTVVKTAGSTPRKAGSQMLVLENGEIIGTVGGGGAEAHALEAAGRAFATGQSQLIDFSMTSDVAARHGMACGGDMELFVQYIGA